MLKQEFDEISRKFGYSSCDPDVYEKGIEPVYMTFCDLLGDTAKEDMVRFYWGHENSSEYNMWGILRMINDEINLVETARKNAIDTFQKAGFKSAPAKILQGFWDARNELYNRAAYLIGEWRKVSKIK